MTDLTDPADYPRRILLAVTGMSPQIITETLYALACRGEPAFVPTEIHLITTETGARNAELELLDDGHGQLSALCADYGLERSAIAFDADHVHVVHDGEHALADIRSAAANNAAANLINQLVRQFCADDTAAVHASIAGGRKTMGFYLGYCLSLHGRDQDALSHVLVNEPFESNRTFFFPPKTPAVIRDRNDEPWRTSDAEVTLAPIPFVRMRHGLTDQLITESTSFSETVALADNAVRRDPTITVDIPNRKLRVYGVPIGLSEFEMAVYTFFAERRQQGDEQGLPRNLIDQADWDDYVAIANRIMGASVRNELLETMKNRDGYFDTHITRIKNALETRFSALAKPFLIVRRGRKGHSRYGLFNLQPEHIEIVEE